MTLTKNSNISVDGVDLFYRSAGSPSNPVILLLHGFPSSSHQFRNLIPLLALNYYVIAPDLPGFGFTVIPETRQYKYTFANLAITVGAFVDALKISKFAIYIFDYGAPTGLRLALERPEAITAIISQNGNAYEEGLGAFWDPIKALWASGSTSDREVLLNSILTFDATIWQYHNGAPNPGSVSPETYIWTTLLWRDPGTKISSWISFGIMVQTCLCTRNSRSTFGKWLLRRSSRPFMTANANLHPDNMAISCSNGELVKVRFCLAKDLSSYAVCRKVARHSCQRGSLVIAPVR